MHAIMHGMFLPKINCYIYLWKRRICGVLETRFYFFRLVWEFPTSFGMYSSCVANTSSVDQILDGCISDKKGACRPSPRLQLSDYFVSLQSKLARRELRRFFLKIFPPPPPFVDENGRHSIDPRRVSSSSSFARRKISFLDSILTTKIHDDNRVRFTKRSNLSRRVKRMRNLHTSEWKVRERNVEEEIRGKRQGETGGGSKR